MNMNNMLAQLSKMFPQNQVMQIYNQFSSMQSQIKNPTGLMKQMVGNMNQDQILDFRNKAKQLGATDEILDKILK